MAKRTQRTTTDFLCLTISAGGGAEESTPIGPNFGFRVQVQSDATGAKIVFRYHDSVHNHSRGVDQLDRDGLLFALWSFCQDCEAGSLDFASYCDEYGENVDSISARRTWQACKAARAKFDRLFHDDREPSFVLEQLAVAGIE